MLLHIQLEALINRGCFESVEDKLGVFDAVTQQRHVTRPLSTSTRCSYFVAHAIADHLAFALRERKQNVQSLSSHRHRGIELLGCVDERDVLGIKSFYDPGKIHERATELVDFVKRANTSLTLMLLALPRLLAEFIGQTPLEISND